MQIVTEKLAVVTIGCPISYLGKGIFEFSEFGFSEAKLFLNTTANISRQCPGLQQLSSPGKTSHKIPRTNMIKPPLHTTYLILKRFQRKNDPLNIIEGKLSKSAVCS